MEEPRAGTQGSEHERASRPQRRSTDRAADGNGARLRSGRRSDDDAKHQRAEARDAAERKYRAFFDNLRELVFLLEAVRDGHDAVVDWIFRELNATALDAIGRERNDVTGRRVSEVFAPEEAQTVIARCEAVVTTGEPFQDEVSFRGRDFLRSVFRLDENTAASAGTDISERKRFERTLRESEMRFRTLADSAPLLISSTDAEDRFDLLNRSFVEFFGVDPARIVEFDWHTALHPDDAARYALNVRASTALGGRSRRACERVAPMENGAGSRCARTRAGIQPIVWSAMLDAASTSPT